MLWLSFPPYIRISTDSMCFKAPVTFRTVYKFVICTLMCVLYTIRTIKAPAAAITKESPIMLALFEHAEISIMLYVKYIYSNIYKFIYV